MSRRITPGYLLILPLAAVLAGGLLVPIGSFLVYSFYKPGIFTFEPGFTLENYAKALADQTYWRLAINSLEIGVVGATLSVVLGYLLAYYVVGAGRLKHLLLALISVSVFGGYLVRIYAWRIILGSQGILNTALMRLGVIDQPWELLFTKTAVIVALLNVYIPFAALLIYAALENVESDVVQAARDLGADSATAFRKVVLPLTGRASYLAWVFVFLLTAADYVTPQLVGGKNGAMLGMAISDQFLRVGNWPLGSALSFIMAAVCVGVAGLAWLLLRAARIVPRRGT